MQDGSRPAYVQIGQIAVASRQPIGVLGLGSCVALGLMDGIGGHAVVAHISLPDEGPDHRFAGAAVPAAIAAALHVGMVRACIRAWVAGGANVVPLLRSRIGERNVESILVLLQGAGIPLAQADVGGTRGRSVIFDPVQLTMLTRYVTSERPGAGRADH